VGEFFEVHPVVLIGPQRFLQELFGDGADVEFQDKVVYFLILYFPDQLLLVFGLPGRLAHEHLEEDDAQGPDVGFEGVLVPFEGLGGHVEGRAHVVLIGLEGVCGFDGESEVGYFELLGVGDEDIGRFEVSVDDIFPGEVEVACEDLLDELEGFSFGEAFFEGFVEVGVAEFGDDVGVVFGGVDFVEGEDVGERFEFLEDLDLALEEDFIDLVFEHAEVDDFDGDGLAGLVAAAFVDLAGVAFADGVVEAVGVGLDFLAGEGGAHLLCFSNLRNNNI